MSKLKDPINIDQYLANLKRNRDRIYRVGIELEGGWKTLPSGIGELAHDGSVNIDPYTYVGVKSVGELPSPPMAMGEWQAWLKKYYPDFVNETCGMHVHLSLRTAFAYQRLMRPEFPATIVAYVGKWANEEQLSTNHPIWDRLADKSRYCRHQFFADDQVKSAHKEYDQRAAGNRYTVVNYPWTRYKTIECRLLPMMENVDLAIKAITRVINITNAFLVATAKREEKLQTDIIADGDELIETKQVYV